MKKILLVSDGIFHPPFLGRMVLHKTLKSLPDFQFKQIRSMEKLPKNLDDFSALAIFIHHPTISEQAISNLEGYVTSGGGVLAIHSATASAKNDDRFTNILGGKFIGHGPVESFSVTPVNPESEIFRGIPDFEVTDELYIHELQPDIETHFTTIYDGQPVPMVWTRQYGQGRVCYACPGHRTDTMHLQEYQEILKRGFAWVSGEA
jgi:type 1 glutamine amidotransferase